MNWRLLAWGGLAVAALVPILGGGWLLTLPAASAFKAPPPIAKEEHNATLAALKPPKRQRPLIAIVGINDMTETTDYLMPYGILKRADVADVVTLATGPGPVTLFPVLKVEPDATIAAFDAAHPDGADYVIVPAMSRDDDPAVVQWIRRQAENGAMIVGVCAGGKVLASAGLLDGRQATTHWFYVKDWRDKHPEIRYVANRRIVVDRGVATTTGISASMPMSLTLVEAIAGRAKAEAVAREIGVGAWDARHDSGAFKFTRPFALTAIANTLAFWSSEQLGLALTPGIDEVSLALVADSWSRTYRSHAVTFAATGAPQTTRNGLRIYPQQVATDWPAAHLLPAVGTTPPAQALDQALKGIETRYGAGTADFVAMQLEYPRR
ncbi:DJ-1/PfpI family protein [Bradyrhizobium sp. ISRA443]|uniref:DJ-1/PfpI family protein n=1 Tax=unclassified Bradyrhizobium TaxID=2631580 RepID=UPI0024790E72|nr:MULTISPECIES: DJ-1/PfpI family protein [unclassified Bradyrhizobium]WGS01841.1 DJ-1/PfpI family protein [Bradyrhizobium sp. ISRA436]WGS08727.1 DJ-1/PfpI family protein [Bradyrhizobium sp. ISRA437]WGS15615.1 DJ-1/PfpI family protein [Bradyrhizobium sp. ISRA443]